MTASGFLLWISAYKDCMEGCRAHSPKLRTERWWVPQHRHVSWNAWGTADLSIRRWWNSKPPPQPWRNQSSLTFIDPPLQAAWKSLQSILSCTKSTKEYKRDTKRVVKRVIKCHQMSLPPWSQRSNSHRRNRTLSQTSLFFGFFSLPVFGAISSPSCVTSIAVEACLKAMVIFTFGSTFQNSF